MEIVLPLNILVIDDERSIREGCRLSLTHKGHVVDTCPNGQAGLEAILKGVYDIVLLDLRLPDMDGMEILRTVSREGPPVCIIIITGFSTVKGAVEAMKAGAFDYLSKPFSNNDLVLAVERALEKKRLIEENLSLRKEVLDRFGFQNIIGENPRILEIYQQVQKVAPLDSMVILYGESGTGKELFARAIYANSRRAGRPFVAADFSALSPGILESELFGHVKGAFTGALESKTGFFEMAQGGTLFLDEVSNLSLDVQGKLLRVLEAQEYKPVGGSQIKKSDVRVISATNRDLKAMVEEGHFREDLYYRLNVFPIFIPPLQERKDDIPRLAYFFLKLFCRKTGKNVEGFSDGALEALVQYEWPGNVRELKNIIERLVILAEGRTLENVFPLFSSRVRGGTKADRVPETTGELRNFKQRLIKETYEAVEKMFLIKALEACQGNITQAALRVGMQRPYFHSLIKRYGLKVKGPKTAG
jgi:DNA-binding NtrC family response regulator